MPIVTTNGHMRPHSEDPMARIRQGSSTRGRTASSQQKAGARTPAAQKHATTPDPVRQRQALANQGSQGRMAMDWGTRMDREEDDDEDDTPPTLH